VSVVVVIHDIQHEGLVERISGQEFSLHLLQPTAKCHTYNDDLRVGTWSSQAWLCRPSTSKLLISHTQQEDGLGNTDSGIERGTGKHPVKIGDVEMWAVHHHSQYSTKEVLAARRNPRSGDKDAHDSGMGGWWQRSRSLGVPMSPELGTGRWR